MLKKLFSHTAIYGIAPQVPKIAGVLSLPLITRYLTELDYGVSGVVTAISGAIAVLGTLGLRLILVNTFYKSPSQYKWAWRQIYGFLTLWNLPYAVLLGVVLYFFIPPEAYDNRWLILGLNVLPIVCFGPTSTLGTTYYQLKQQPLQIASRTAIFGILTVLLNVYFIAILKMGYIGWFLSNCIVSVLSNASYWLPLNKKLGFTPIFNFKWRYIKQSLSVALPTVPHYYSTYLVDTSDRLVMKFTKVPTGDIGLYNVAYTVGNLVNNFNSAATVAVGPLMNEAYKKNKDIEARNLVFVLQIVSLGMTFFLSIWIKELFFVLIKNKSLQKVYPLGIIIIMAYNYRPMYAGANAKLFYLEKTKLLLKVTFIAGILNLLLNFLFIPIYGYAAAAYVTFASLMYMGYGGFFLKGFKENSSVDYFPLTWLFFTIILTVAAYYLVDTSISIKILLSVAVFLQTGWLVRKTNRSMHNTHE